MKEELLKPIQDAVLQYLKDHPYLGWAIAAALIFLLVISFLASTIPKVEIVKSTILKPLARWLKFKKLEKAAIKSDVKGNINMAADELRNELPKDWVKQAQIEWVQKEDPADFAESEMVVLRMRPLNNQDRNYVTALFYYMRKIIFPGHKGVIPENHLEATALFLARRYLDKTRPDAKKVFEDCILEPKIDKRKNILDCIENYTPLDQRGFYSGFFLRESEKVAEKSKFSNSRYSVGSEVSDILKHAKQFIDKKGSIDDFYWHHKGKLSSYAFVLVANPYKSRQNTQPYVNRALEKVKIGTERIYIFGTEKEKWFVEKVIKDIVNKTNLELVEQYELHRDYRGKLGGIGALFSNSEKSNAGN